MKRPKIIVTSARTEMAELSGIVTVGAESAARLGVPVGTQIDLGTLAYYHRNPLKRFFGGLRKIRKNPFN